MDPIFAGVVSSIALVALFFIGIPIGAERKREHQD